MTELTMPTSADPTLDPARRSWVDSANAPDCDFPIQNLPLGVFRRAGADEKPRIGVAIGDAILDLAACVEEEALAGISPETACALCAPSLNRLMSQGRPAWSALRAAVGDVLDADAPDPRKRCLLSMSDAELLLPAVIGDYTDFYASIHHAANVGSMFRPDNPLLPNYKHLPVGYHGRSSSIVPSGTPIRRPCGQTATEDAAPTFGPSRLLDYELEMGFFTGPASTLGTRVTMAEAADRIFGMVILNDWSARDVQKWEYQPLGPFNAKNFATTISPWVVSLQALGPFRIAGPQRPDSDPPVLEYLQPAGDMGFDITVEAHLSSQAMRDKNMEPYRVSRGTFADMYWTIAQMLVHHTSTGCNLEPGDLLASGTVSGPGEETRGCLLERTWRGQNPITLPDGTERKFLADGDEVIIRAFCEREGAARIGFGECRGIIEPAT